MKKAFLKIGYDTAPVYIPGRSNRRHPQRRFGSAAFKSGVDPDEDDEDDEDDEEDLTKEERMFMRRQKKAVGKQIRAALKAQGTPVTTESVDAAIAKHFGDVKIDAFRAFDFEANGAAVTKLAADFEAFKQNGGTLATPDQKRGLRQYLAEKAEDITSLYKGKRAKEELKINVRALKPVMTTGNVIAGEEIPEDILNSYTVGEFVAKRYGQQYIYDIASRTVVQNLGEYRTWLEEGAIDGAFAVVAEGALKPLMSADLVRNYVKSKKVAAKFVVTEETVKWRENIYNIIVGLIRDKMVRDLQAILTIDLNAQAAGYVGTALDDTIVAPNDYDAVAAVAAQIETLNFNPDVLILHPQDKWRIRVSKDDDNRYLFPVVTENGVQSIMGFRIVTSTYQTLGTFTLGEAGLFKIEEEPVQVRMGYGLSYTTSGGNVTSVEDDFDHNRFRIIVETFFRDYIATAHLGSFVRASFATVKAALLKP